jgi:hypothetical protein
MESLSSIVSKDCVVQGMLFGEPTLRPEQSTVIEVARAASEGKVGVVNDDLAIIEALDYQDIRCNIR